MSLFYAQMFYNHSSFATFVSIYCERAGDVSLFECRIWLLLLCVWRIRFEEMCAEVKMPQLKVY